jgi:hypothetical protein
MATGLDLGKQVGPLPLGAWAAIVAGGLGIAWYTRKSTPVNVPVNDTSGNTGVGGGAGWIAVAPPTESIGGAGKPTTNEEWAVAAINYLVHGGKDPAAADLAIRKYLESQSLSVMEKAMISEALLYLGSLPQPLPVPVDQGLSAPANLRITSTTRDSITLVWDPVAGAKRYIVSLQGVLGWWKNDYDETPVPYYTAGGLNSNTEYTFSVYAQDVAMHTPGFVSANQSPTSGISGKTAP